MVLYRFFFLRDGRPINQMVRDFADDLDALDAAREFCQDHVVEVYREMEFVARVKQGDAPLNVKDSRSL